MEKIDEIIIEAYGGWPDMLNIENLKKSMKLYANDKLDEAASNLRQTGGQFNSDFSMQKQSILNLKDKI